VQKTPEGQHQEDETGVSVKKKPANKFEALFDDFVIWMGGEVVSDCFPQGQSLPENADYFFFDRKVIAELKCLDKDFFSDYGVGAVVTKLINEAIQRGEIQGEHWSGNLLSLPQPVQRKVLKIFVGPIKTAVEKANSQIKSTRSTFGLTGAKGLLILVNENNQSMQPELALQVLASLLRERYRSIDSFVYLVDSMSVYAPSVGFPARLWADGYVRSRDDGVGSDAMRELRDAWLKFRAEGAGGDLAVFMPEHNELPEIRLTK